MALLDDGCGSFLVSVGAELPKRSRIMSGELSCDACAVSELLGAAIPNPLSLPRAPSSTGKPLAMQTSIIKYEAEDIFLSFVILN